MFKVGQKVVYITGKNMEKGSIHVVSDTERKPCGCNLIAINGNRIIRTPNNGLKSYCQSCNVLYDKSYYISGNNWKAESFQALDESFAEEALEMIKEQIEEEELITV